MLTPQDIDNKAFEKTVFGGYDMTMVDNFLESISGDYNALYKENAILKSKLKVLVEKVEEYRSTEDAMRMALLTAQRMGEDIIADANKKSEDTIESAKKEAAERLTDMEMQITGEEIKLQAASEETAKFIETTRAMLQKHLEFLTKLETARRVNAPSKAPAPEPEAAPEQKQEQTVADAANEIIANALEDLKETDAEAQPPEAEAKTKDAEDTKVYVIKDVKPAEEKPKAKIDFENLKFGSNFKNEE